MSLDIPEPQIALNFPLDANYAWHHRILLRRIEAAQWVVLTPDSNLEVEDLAQHAVLPLWRNSPLPQAIQGQTYMAGANIAQELDQHHRTAEQLVAILAPPGGAVAVAAAGAKWRIADTAAVDFAEVVLDAVMASHNTGVIKVSVGLAQVGAAGRWVPVERVQDDDLDQWRAEKQAGAGRDPRLQPFFESDNSDHLVSLADARRAFRPVDLNTVKHWPHEGPRALQEVISSINAIGLNFFTYHAHWEKTSGVNGESSISHEHSHICQTLGLAICYDGLDASNCAGLELAARRMVQIERAVKVNPKAPCFVGLTKMTQHALDEGGGLATSAFTKHMSTLAAADAQIMKQNRLLREELDAKLATGGGGGNKRKGGKDPPKDDGK